ncbi:MAG: nucleotidyltransferase domain-containing protein [Thermodesulfobacteriota bacterium]
MSELADVVNALRLGLEEDLVSVVLFGSRARSEAGPESDWDLLVLARQLPEYTQKARAKQRTCGSGDGLALEGVPWFQLVTRMGGRAMTGYQDARPYRLWRRSGRQNTLGTFRRD